MRNLALLLITCVLVACRPTPFKVQTISTKEPTKIDEASAQPSKSSLKDTTAAKYKKANSPSFAIINGYYRLPTAQPFGAATLVKAYSYDTSFEAMSVSTKDRSYAVEPMSGDDANVMVSAINQLLDIGVKIKEISMTDALAISQAEQAAAKKGKAFLMNESLAPNVDYLMSIYSTNSSLGPVLVGRVIKRDGSLVAFRVMYRSVNSNLMGELITSLFEDTIYRI